jgi:hypothetical protein
VRVCVTVCVWLGDSDWLGDADPLGDADCEDVCDMLLEALWLGVRETEAVCVGV